MQHQIILKNKRFRKKIHTKLCFKAPTIASSLASKDIIRLAKVGSADSIWWKQNRNKIPPQNRASLFFKDLNWASSVASLCKSSSVWTNNSWFTLLKSISCCNSVSRSAAPPLIYTASTSFLRSVGSVKFFQRKNWIWQVHFFKPHSS